MDAPVAAAFGIYVHIPFCAARCDYCAFAIWTDRHHLQQQYLAALRTDIDRHVARDMATASSIYVGGGTPSLVDPHRLAAVIASIPRRDDAEVTVECNPDDASAERFAVFRSAGVTRLSFGIQSMADHVLASLGRSHRQEHVPTALALAKDAGLSVNADLIYGAAGETLADWERTVTSVLALGPDHVSAYGLTVEPGTPLAGQPARHPDDDLQAEMYELADELLDLSGYANYEVSNWARPGHRSAHNELYWAQGDYRGFGCAAHSHADGRRWWNVRTPDRYIRCVENGEATEAAGESLDDATRALERLQLALRTDRGVPRSALADDDLSELEALGHVRVSDGRIRLTRTGRLLANAIAVRLRPVG
jgi:putative oxygen-independent coproporphyrinogen III oxidase